MPDSLERSRTRIKCEHTHRLIATIEISGLRIWCKYEKKSELITWEVIDAARKVQGQQETCQEAC